MNIGQQSVHVSAMDASAGNRNDVVVVVPPPVVPPLVAPPPAVVATTAGVDAPPPPPPHPLRAKASTSGVIDNVARVMRTTRSLKRKPRIWKGSQE
jgi:hypothetical protein